MKHPHRSGNPAKREAAQQQRNQMPSKAQLANAIAIGIANLLESGYRIVSPQGNDVSDALAYELGVELEPKPQAEADSTAGRLLVVSGGKVEEHDVPAKRERESA